MALENLDEMVARVARRPVATWSYLYVENAVTYLWQPETLAYNDVTTGRECWKITDGKLTDSYCYKDIGIAPWSADGQKIAIGSNRRCRAIPYYDPIWFHVNANGSCMRPAAGSAGRDVGGPNGLRLWCPQRPNTYFEIGFQYPFTLNAIYRTTLSSTNVPTPTLLLDGYPENIALWKNISADGKKLGPWSRSYPPTKKIFPTTVWPTQSVDVPAGYTIDRSLGAYGSTPATYQIFHDAYWFGLGDWYIALPQTGNENAWWKLKVHGSAADGGPLYDNTGYPVRDMEWDFGECIPVNAQAGVGKEPDPWNYNLFPGNYIAWSHFVPDRWGRHALFSNWPAEPPVGGYGPAVWDIDAGEMVVETFGGEAQHNDWHAFSDWCVSTGQNTLMILCQKYDDVDSQYQICHSHKYAWGGTAYHGMPRPGQSPDGTKVLWHSEFLGGATYNDVFWSVCYYPYPPTDLAATGSGGLVTLTWLPPVYTSRRWINRSTGLLDEVNGEVLYAREIKQYNVWRSANGTTGWSLVGSTTAYYANHATTNTLIHLDGAAGSEVDASHKPSCVDTPGDGTWYYAVTSQEHSDLESDQLSEVLSVTVASGAVTATSVAHAKGTEDFWTTRPTVPTELTVTAQEASGHYRLDWTEPADTTKIRYYNLYYSSSGTQPTATQQFRIASIPVGHATWLDWLAHTTATPLYGITSVDRYQNESLILLAGEEPPAPPPDERGYLFFA